MKGDTAQHILAIAQDLVQQRGYSAFSYADIADRLGIRKASIHYHFASKDVLVQALVQRYRDRFAHMRHAIDQSGIPADQQLIRFAGLYRDGLTHQHLCLCGMLSADFTVLPVGVQQDVQAFFAENQHWLEQVVNQGQRSGGITLHASAGAIASHLLATLQGAQFMARCSAESSVGAIAIFDAIIQTLFQTLFTQS
jgi:TetR/AcrR family transcriptional repressor of nem operon